MSVYMYACSYACTRYACVQTCTHIRSYARSARVHRFDAKLDERLVTQRARLRILEEGALEAQLDDKAVRA